MKVLVTLKSDGDDNEVTIAVALVLAHYDLDNVQISYDKSRDKNEELLVKNSSSSAELLKFSGNSEDSLLIAVVKSLGFYQIAKTVTPDIFKACTNHDEISLYLLRENQYKLLKKFGQTLIHKWHALKRRTLDLPNLTELVSCVGGFNWLIVDVPYNEKPHFGVQLFIEENFDEEVTPIHFVISHYLSNGKHGFSIYKRTKSDVDMEKMASYFEDRVIFSNEFLLRAEGNFPNQAVLNNLIGLAVS